MQSLPVPKTFKVYILIKQSGVLFSTVKNMAVNSLGTGFFLTREEAEHNRTIEELSDTTVTGQKPKWHIFELEFPNPVYKE